MQLRHFPDSVEALARQWSTGPAIAELNWTAGDARYGGTLRAFRASCSIAEGVAKPGSIEVDPSHQAVAAHEKICADLAFHLGLPVPPATLWHRTGAPAGHSKLVVVSAFPFEQVYSWRQLAGVAHHAVHFLSGLSDPASAMAVFDTWVSNPDRFNDENLLVSPGRHPAYLDFANGLSFIWAKDGYQVPGAVACYPGQLTANLNTMSHMVTQVTDLPRELIEWVVDRVPRLFLPKRERDLIVDGLLYRQSHLRKYMQQQFPGLP